MSRPRIPDTTTLSLFDWEPPRIVERFPEVITRAATLRSSFARAISAAMKESGKSRAKIAAEMTESLGEEITENMLNAYASEARQEHTIPHIRLLALAWATNDARLLQLGADTMGKVVIDAKWLPWVEVGQLADKKDEIDRAFDATRRAARRSQR